MPTQILFILKKKKFCLFLDISNLHSDKASYPNFNIPGILKGKKSPTPIGLVKAN